MDQDTRLEQIERRLALLEAQIREFRQASGGRPAREATQATPSGERAGGVAPSASIPADVPLDARRPPPPVPSPPTRQRPKSRWPTADRDLEKWFGENALLVVGLLALVTAAGFMLKYAFDRGWISPGLRVSAGLIVGLALAAWGERAQRKGMGRYGSALVGGGGALAYLSLWAAAGPYQLISPQIGIVALAALSGLIVLSAAVGATQYLAAMAAVGAFMAPIILGDAGSSPNVLLAYTGVVAVATGWLGARRGWQTAFGLTLAGFFLLPAAFVLRSGDSALWSVYLVLGGTGALAVARLRGWPELRIGAFVIVWSLLAAKATDVDGYSAWLLVLLLPVLVAPLFLAYVQMTGGRGPPESASAELRRRASLELDRTWGYLLASAAAWAWVTMLVSPRPLDAYPLVLLGGISIPYLALALNKQHPRVLAIGFGFLAWGVAAQIEGLGMTVGWAVLALLSAAATLRAGLARGRWIGLGLAGLAAFRLLTSDLVDRPAAESALIGPWSLVLFLLIAVFVALASPLWGEPPLEESKEELKIARYILWIGAGLLLLVGGTQEIFLYFDGARETARELVRDLSVSAFWLLYAGSLIAYGFWREKRAVRLAGLGVTGLAILKVTFYDLTRLEALNRVAVLALLALIALVAAHAYHRRSRAKDEAPGVGPTPSG